MKILLVEDEQMCQMAITNFAKKLSIDIDIANNGLEAVDKFKKNTYNIILMDMYMPEMNGFQATEIIRSANKDIIIIALSGGEYIY
jgi:CheY-like chemotaxis protein